MTYQIADEPIETSLRSYVLSLQTGQNTPFTPKQTYDLAKSQFQAVYGAAQAGDYNSLQQLQQFSDAFLNASRDMFGSGQGFPFSPLTKGGDRGVLLGAASARTSARIHPPNPPFARGGVWECVSRRHTPPLAKGGLGG